MLHLSNFPNITAYCQQVKSIADQLANIDNPVSEVKLVLRLVSGLVNTDYDTVASMIQQTDPLPSFQNCRSRLLLEETRRANDPTINQQSLVASQQPAEVPSNPPSSASFSNRGGGGRDGGRGGRNGGRGGRGRGRGRYNNSSNNNGNFRNNNNNSRSNNSHYSPPSQFNHMPTWHTSQQAQQQWGPNFQQHSSWPNYSSWPYSSAPPCPYPSYGPALPRPNNGLLGPAPRGPVPHQQAHSTTTNYGPAMTPIELGNAFSSMRLTQNDDGWYMDSGATSHMTNNSGLYFGACIKNQFMYLVI